MTALAQHQVMHAGSTPASAAHRIALALVWLTVASGAIVFTEPAPFDVCALGLLVLLPALGLVRATPALLGYVAVMLVPVGCALLAILAAIDGARASTAVPTFAAWQSPTK